MRLYGFSIQTVIYFAKFFAFNYSFQLFVFNYRNLFVWYHSAHTRLIDRPINDALRLVTGCLRPTPTADLYALAGIQPSELRPKRATLSLARRAQDPKHMLHERLLSPP